VGTNRIAGKVRRLHVSVVLGVALLAVLAGAAPAATEETSGGSNAPRLGSGSPFPSDEGTQGPFAPKDCAVPRERPLRLVLRCEGMAVIVNGISWRTWGQGRAEGEGRLEFERKRYPVKLEIRRVRKRLCGDERLPMFTRVALDFKDKRPDFKRTPRKLRCSLLDSGWTP
jgi:hypothetical protein